MIADTGLYREMLDSLYEGVYFVDTNRRIIFWNKGAERITGFKSEEIIGKHCFANILNHVDDNNNNLCEGICPLHKTIMDGQRRESGVYLHHKKGHRVSVAVRTVPLIKNDEIIGAVEVFEDNNKQAQINKTINELKTFALYDQLTELPNRRYLDSYMENRFKEFVELKIPFSVVMIDIDFFKKVNDTYGHDIGDKVLQVVAKTIKNSFRKSDVVGRWGGEEFMAILTGPTKDNLLSIIEKSRALVSKSSLRIQPDPIQATISIGATMVEKNDTIESLVKRADKALYNSKENGRNMSTVV